MYIHWIAQLVPVILIRWIVIYPVKSAGPELKPRESRGLRSRVPRRTGAGLNKGNPADV